MHFICTFILISIPLGYSFPSQERPMQSLLDGSKLAFIRAPYVNTVKIQKDSTLEEDVSARWPNGVIRYYVDKQSYDDTFENLLRSPIRIIQSSSCIKFMSMKEKPLDNTTWIHITNPKIERECNHVPRTKDTGEIELVFGYHCLKTNELLHTLLHGIGIKDEVTHPHRDKYIRVLWDNIHPAYQHLYRKQAEKTFQTLVEYDPLSVMHFYDRAFSRNGQATITPLEPGLKISPSDTLSHLDKMRLQIYFGHKCNKRKVSNLLKTCKKTYGGTNDKQVDEKEDQDTDYDKLNEDVSIENGNSGISEKETQTIKKESILMEDEKNDVSEKVTEEKEDNEIMDDKDTDDQRDISNHESKPKEEEQSANENVSEHREDTSEGLDEIKNKNENSEDNKNNEGELHQENEESTEYTNIITEKPDNTTLNKISIDSTNENDITDGVNEENNLTVPQKQMLSDRDSDANIGKTYETIKSINKQPSDSESHWEK